MYDGTDCISKGSCFIQLQVLLRSQAFPLPQNVHLSCQWCAVTVERSILFNIISMIYLYLPVFPGQQLSKLTTAW